MSHRLTTVAETSLFAGQSIGLRNDDDRLAFIDVIAAADRLAVPCRPADISAVLTPDQT